MNEGPQVTTADEMVRYVEALAPKARAELDALAARDREYGEDVTKELASSTITSPQS